MPEPGHVTRNRELWTTKNAEYTDPDALRAWLDPEFKWGVFGVPQHELGVLGDVAGLDVVELGCGTAFESARLVGVRAPAGAERHAYYSDHDPEWARNWPMEEIWVARKTG